RGLVRHGFRAKTELENDPVPMTFQRREERLVDVGRINVALRGPGLGASGECSGHLRITDREIINVGRDMRGRGNYLVVGNAVDVMRNGGMNVFEGSDDSFGCRTRAAGDGRRAGGSFSPAPFQFVKRGVELAPLAAREETPFERVLQPLIVLTGTASGDFGAGAQNFEPIQNPVMPGA